MLAGHSGKPTPGRPGLCLASIRMRACPSTPPQRPSLSFQVRAGLLSTSFQRLPGYGDHLAKASSDALPILSRSLPGELRGSASRGLHAIPRAHSIVKCARAGRIRTCNARVRPVGSLTGSHPASTSQRHVPARTFSFQARARWPARDSIVNNVFAAPVCRDAKASGRRICGDNRHSHKSPVRTGGIHAGAVRAFSPRHDACPPYYQKTSPTPFPKHKLRHEPVG